MAWGWLQAAWFQDFKAVTLRERHVANGMDEPILEDEEHRIIEGCLGHEIWAGYGVDSRHRMRSLGAVYTLNTPVG
jgi:hypothetical protein